LGGFAKVSALPSGSSILSINPPPPGLSGPKVKRVSASRAGAAAMDCKTSVTAQPIDLIDQVDWKQLRLVLANFERLIAKSSPAKLRSCPVMQDAVKRFRSGEINLWNWGRVGA